MKAVVFSWEFPALLMAVFLMVSPEALAQTKYIRLRNETIVTTPAVKAAALAAAPKTKTPATGLFLVQFEGTVDPAWREQLRSQGVELLKYVPDDTFIARFDNVSPDAVRALGFVRWVEPYRPDHKVHPRLTAAMREAAQTNLPVEVNVLLSPQATRAEITAARSLLSSVAHETRLRQGVILRGALLPGRLDALAQSSAVLWVEPAPRRKLLDEAAAKIVGGDDGLLATRTVTQQEGYDGTGITVCVADTGLDTGDTNTMHPDLRGRVTGFSYYSLTDGSDGYGHGTHCAGIVAGNAATGETDPNSGQWYGLGVAPGASLYVERIFDDNANPVSPFPSDETLTEGAVRHGAKIGSNSWGDDVNGEYDTDAAQFDELVRDADAPTPGDQPYVLEFSAGNAGPDSQTMDSPASAKNVIATGASENTPGYYAELYGLYADGLDTMADFSSRGPCEDGRIKPDVVAPGTWIASAASTAAADESAIAWTAIDNYYVYMGGTSMSGPHAAGAAAVFMQFYESTHTNAVPSPALVKAALINSANELDELNGGPGPIPNFDEGWGRIALTNIVVTNVNTAQRYYEYVDQSVLLTNGQAYETHVLVQTSSQPLKITLAYTDVPGFPGAIPALVNDLDLEVVGPDGTLYRGNQFSGSDSTPNATATDTLNNVEAVHLSQPAPGDYLIRVRGTHVVQDARLDTTAVDQDFALVASGDLARPGAGSILLDRPSYTAPGTMNLTVFDTALAGRKPVIALVKSTTEPAGEICVLPTAGNYGSFTGAVATVTGTAAAGQIQIANGDAIEADYTDSSGVLHTATATADLTAPGLSGVTVTTDLGVITITWQTTEPSSSTVRYGTNHLFNLTASDPTLTTNHLIRLTGLAAGVTYQYFVVSTDGAGNAGTNNNGGINFQFTGVTTPMALVVDDYDTAAESANGATVIPDSSYTNALNAAGITYGFWKVNTRGAGPQLSDLKPFPMVIWRTTDDLVNYGVDGDGLPDPTATNNTLSAEQQIMIQDYLNGGGSFFLASMDILSQLGNVPFRKEVLQVGGFVENSDPPAPCSDCDENFGVPAILGTTGNPIGGGVNVTLNYSSYPSFDDGLGDIYGPDFSDTFTPAPNATTLFVEPVSGKPCGMSYPPVGTDSPGRVVFLSFPLDSVPATGTAPDTEAALLQSALKFLAPGANGIGVITLDQSVYTVPDQVTVEVGDSDLIGAPGPQVIFSTSSSTNKATLTLSPTARPGLFRGYLTLASSGAASNQLAVLNGDTLTAKYFDVSNGSNAVATASIDTTPPVVSEVSASAGIESATVSWVTSKPANSLVQYGESALLDRTGSASGLVTNHSVTIGGLAANRTYFYAVTSRDAAGNSTTDDNQGTNYTFSTIPAPQPPWSDNLEGGVAGWSVVPDPVYGSDINWSPGTPNNGLVTSAHSGTNAWGSDLNGSQNFFLASTYLYSPFIDLSSVKSATLTFWDVCDFSGPYEDGVLYISTNSSTPPGSLPMAADFSGTVADNWEQETVSLDAYVGQTIQLVFYYEGVVVDTTVYGWTLDDFSITGTAGGGGTITVSKNLGQGSFTLTGPLSETTGTAPSTTFSNLPAGLYTVQFSDVAFYQTPPDQSNTLTDGGTLTFPGNYTFIDLNSNGISDAWEDYYFGSAPTNRTPSTDTDGSGLSDYGKFMAGLNPTNPASQFIFLSTTLETNHTVLLEWSALPGRLYQVESSSNLVSWTPVTGWLQAAGSPMSFAATNANAHAGLFRVQVRP